MPFIQTVSEEDAAGKLREIYEADLKNQGYVPNHVKALSLRPEVIEAWRAFSGVVRGKMRLRQYELVTFAAALALHCSH